MSSQHPGFLISLRIVWTVTRGLLTNFIFVTAATDSFWYVIHLWLCRRILELPYPTVLGVHKLLCFHIKSYFDCKYFYCEIRGKREESFKGRLYILSTFSERVCRRQRTKISSLQTVLKNVIVQSTDATTKPVSQYVSQTRNKCNQLQFTSWYGIAFHTA